MPGAFGETTVEDLSKAWKNYPKEFREYMLSGLEIKADSIYKSEKNK